MASLNVRKLDDDTYEQLRLRAVKHGVSIEEEVKFILIQTVAAPENISDVFSKYFGSKNGITLKFRRKPHEPLDFNR